MESFMLAETYVPKNELIRVAKAVLRAQDIKEESWDATDSKYTKSDGESAIQAVNEYGLNDVWETVISNWNFSMWNDCQYWAQEILKVLD